jgi:hypothetical protein
MRFVGATGSRAALYEVPIARTLQKERWIASRDHSRRWL